MKVRAIDDLPGLLLVEPVVYGDSRGFFLESYQRERYRRGGIAETFVQDNHSRSERGTLRGLHFQSPHAQGKLVRASAGEVFDVVVDVRVGSPGFGRWFGTYLSAENHMQLYIPPGFAHGFMVTSDWADFQYKCTEYYHPESEHALIWNDPALRIEWPVERPSLSAKDAAGRTLEELEASGVLPRYAP
ncbi:MAG: dTDP-4-dehydrorhamnose 3,5-epimerase [Gemmatimonadota bacterium]